MDIKDILKDEEYVKIIEPMLDDDFILGLKNIPHHKTSNRLEHSLRVSYTAYKICKSKGLDYKSAARAGLLHDLYFNRIKNEKNIIDKVKLFSNGHPLIALNNARCHYNLNALEENIILSHMWPVSKYRPKYKESYIVGYADKKCSIEDFARVVDVQDLRHRIAYRVKRHV